MLHFEVEQEMCVHGSHFLGGHLFSLLLKFRIYVGVLWPPPTPPGLLLVLHSTEMKPGHGVRVCVPRMTRAPLSPQTASVVGRLWRHKR